MRSCVAEPKNQGVTIDQLSPREESFLERWRLQYIFRRVALDSAFDQRRVFTVLKDLPRVAHCLRTHQGGVNGGDVNKSYFTNDYIKHHDLMMMWRNAFQIDYNPQVDIRKVKKRKKNIKTVYEEIRENISHLSPEDQGHALIHELSENENSSQHAILQAAAEVAKYAVKVSDILKRKNINEIIETLDSVLRNRRFISYGGILDEARKQLKSENKIQDIEKSDLIDFSNDKQNCQCPICQSELVQAQYLWKDSNYFKFKKKGELENET
jgi:hypothetical protein